MLYLDSHSINNLYLKNFCITITNPFRLSGFKGYRLILTGFDPGFKSTLTGSAFWIYQELPGPDDWNYSIIL